MSTSEVIDVAVKSGPWGVLVLFLFWMWRRVKDGALVHELWSETGKSLQEKLEARDAEIAKKDQRIAALTTQLEERRKQCELREKAKDDELDRQRELTEHWQRQLIEHLSRR